MALAYKGVLYEPVAIVSDSNNTAPTDLGVCGAWLSARQVTGRPSELFMLILI